MKTMILTLAILLTVQASAQKSAPLSLKLTVDSCICNGVSRFPEAEDFFLQLGDRPSTYPLTDYDGKKLAIQLLRKTESVNGVDTTLVRYIFYEYVGRRMTQLAASDFMPLEDLGKGRKAEANCVSQETCFRIGFRLTKVSK